MPSDAARQPGPSRRPATTGRKISWPVAPPAVRMPVTSPRLGDEPPVGHGRHRAPAPSTPVPSPISTPQSSISCQLAVMNTVSPLPSATTSSAHSDDPPDAEALHQGGGERRGQPVEHQVDADRGRDRRRPTSRTPSRSGSISTPGAARKPAAPTRASEGHGGDPPGAVDAVGAGRGHTHQHDKPWGPDEERACRSDQESGQR